MKNPYLRTIKNKLRRFGSTGDFVFRQFRDEVKALGETIDAAIAAGKPPDEATEAVRADMEDLQRRIDEAIAKRLAEKKAARATKRR